MQPIKRVSHIQITPVGFRYRWEYKRPPDSTPKPADQLDRALTEDYPNGELQSCVASTVAAAIQYCWNKQPERQADFLPSVLYIYYWARYLEAREGEDAGASINSALRACLSYGFCSEDEWPYIPDNVYTRPSSAVAAAARCAVASFKSIRRNEADLKSCISIDGLPFICALNINADQYFNADPASDIQFGPEPDATHCVLCVGYDEDTFSVLDSMGKPGTSNVTRKIRRHDLLDRNNVKVSDFWMIDKVLGPSEEQDREALDQLRGGHTNYSLKFQSMLADAYKQVHHRDIFAHN